MDILEFTPLEFETARLGFLGKAKLRLEFTPLEFETDKKERYLLLPKIIRIYSVGVWNNSSIGEEYNKDED